MGARHQMGPAMNPVVYPDRPLASIMVLLFSGLRAVEASHTRFYPFGLLHLEMKPSFGASLL